MSESKTIQMHNISPEEFKETIMGEINKSLRALSTNLKPNEPEEYLTRKELSQILKVTLPTIHDWSKKGILKPYRIGKLIRFKKSDLENTLIQINSLNK